MRDVYGCDGRNERCKGEISFEDANWFTSSIGFCDCCDARLHSRVPQTLLDVAYDICDGSGEEADEMAEFVISMTQ